MTTTDKERLWFCDDCGHLNSDKGKELHDGDIVFCEECGAMATIIREDEWEGIDRGSDISTTN